MKRLLRKRICILSVFLIALAIFFGYNYAASNLKSFVTGALERSFGARLSIAHMRISFPLCLELKGIRINDTVSIRKAYIYPSPESMFLKKVFIFSNIRIVDPVIKIKKGQNDVFAGFYALKSDAPKSASKDSKSFFYVSRIDIENGAIIYNHGDGDKFEFVKIDGSLKNPYIYAAGNRPSSFKISGFIKNHNSVILSPLRARGLITRELVIKAKLHAANVALESFGKIYKNYLKDTIVTGNLDMDSKILVSKKDLKADCFCRINDIILKDSSNKIQAPLIANFKVGFDFKNRAIKIDSLKTNLLSLLFSRS